MAETKLGELELVYGPMFAGKSHDLVRRAHGYTAARRNHLILSHLKDKRYTDGEEVVVTHDQRRVKCTQVAVLADYGLQSTDFWDAILIDEAQFFAAADLRAFVLTALQHCHTLVVYGLDSDFRQEAWPWLAALIPLAHKTTKLTAYCTYCPNAANASARTESAMESSVDADGMLVGGADKYEAVCNACHKRACRPLKPCEPAGKPEN